MAQKDFVAYVDTAEGHLSRLSIKATTLRSAWFIADELKHPGDTLRGVIEVREPLEAIMERAQQAAS